MLIGAALAVKIATKNKIYLKEVISLDGITKMVEAAT